MLAVSLFLYLCGRVILSIMAEKIIGRRQEQAVSIVNFTIFGDKKVYCHA